MSNWISPGFPHLKEVVGTSEGHLLLCSPFISAPALNIVYGALPGSIRTVEIWTRLSRRDWLTGASDPEGLLDFIRDTSAQVGPISVRYSNDLHAKIIVSDGPKAMAGSANLTRGGFQRNQEVARVVTGEEIKELRTIVDTIRPQLTPVSQKQFADFVSKCVSMIKTQEALLDLIRGEIPDTDLGIPPLISYQTFVEYLESEDNPIARDLLQMVHNLDGNNNSGKVKQAFFGIQRFLQEYPHHRPFAEALPNDEWFDVAKSGLVHDWFRFLQDYANEVNPNYGYSIPTLRGYLTPSSGGTRIGGGGGDNQLKRVWPLICNILPAE